MFQISCLRAEQTQLSKSLEKERQRAAENRQEYLVAKEEADTQEGRANQLEEEIRELRRKHKQELQDALLHGELLQQVVLLVIQKSWIYESSLCCIYVYISKGYPSRSLHLFFLEILYMLTAFMQ